MKQYTIKAIETEYKGYRFRSRLEARYAVFLDGLREKWEYEIEGYELPSGRYLPDFWLPRLNCWLEIKGTKPTQIETTLCEELAHGTGKPVLLSWNLPANENRLIVFCAEHDDDWHKCCWAWDKNYLLRLHAKRFQILGDLDDRCFLDPDNLMCEVPDAYFNKAKSARFDGKTFSPIKNQTTSLAELEFELKNFWEESGMIV